MHSGLLFSHKNRVPHLQQSVRSYRMLCQGTQILHNLPHLWDLKKIHSEQTIDYWKVLKVHRKVNF